MADGDERVPAGVLRWPRDPSASRLALHIGAARLTFHLHGNDSLKGKRQVSRSLIAKLRGRFNMAAAEVDGMDRHQTLVIGITCVSNRPGHADEMIDAALHFVEGHRIGAELVDVERSVIDGVS